LFYPEQPEVIVDERPSEEDWAWLLDKISANLGEIQIILDDRGQLTEEEFEKSCPPWRCTCNMEKSFNCSISGLVVGSQKRP